jgi:hypothetical protein
MSAISKVKDLRWVFLALALCLISMIGASIVQTSFGKITVKSISWESPQGHQLSAYLFRPPNAVNEHPAPAIVCIEGWFNNKEMQDAYFVELSRRGYVVLALDMHGHGNSENVPVDQLYDGGIGVDGAVQLLATLPYVDSSRIGVTGHSSGGTASNMAIVLDNERKTPLIRANLLQAADWNDDTGQDHSNDFKDRSIGIIASLYDDFYFSWYQEDGTPISLPKDFIKTEQAKQFLNFNDNPSSFNGTPEAGKIYERKFNGTDAYRVIYTPKIIHPWVTFSKTSVGYAVEFFETAFGAPNPLPPGNQIWQWKAFFNFIGLAGFFVFMISFTLAMTRTGFFSSLAAEKTVRPLSTPRGLSYLWFWGGLVLSVAFSGFSYLFVVSHVYGQSTGIFPQTGPLTIGIWSAACGVFNLVIMILSYQFYGKRQPVSVKDIGIIINRAQLLKTILLAFIVITVTYALVFFSTYFFKTDYRIWVLAVKAFGADKIGIALRYLPLFLIFYVLNSISVNSFNYFKICNKEWANTFILALSNSVAAVIIVIIQYGCFFTTGNPFWYMSEAARIGPIWLFPIIIILFGAAVFSRIIYKRTRNPYLAGIINAMMVTLISCTNTTTILGVAKVITTSF